MSMRRRLGLAAVSGLLLSLAFPSWLVPGLRPWTGWVAWFALVPLLAAIEDLRPGRAAAVGWIGGFAYFASALYWIASIRELSYAGVPLCLAFAATLGLYWAAWGWLIAKAGGQGIVLLAAPLWAAQEWLRGVLFTGFPWMPLGASQWDFPSVFLAARYIGVSGIGLGLVSVNVGLWWFLARRPDARPAVWLGAGWLLVLVGVASLARMDAAKANTFAPSVHVVALQGSFTEDEKWSLPVDTMLRRYESLARTASRAHPKVPVVMVWPETATASVIDTAGMIPFLSRLAAHTGASQIVGALKEPAPGRLYNGAFLVTTRGVEGEYLKTHLVPFGEYVPQWCRTLLPFLNALTAQVTNLTPGTSSLPLILPAGTRIGVFVCYEAIFPGLGRQRARQGAGFFVNITNDAWYLRTASTFQHALGPICRAVESGRWVVRAANTGLSLIVDPVGSVQTGPQLFEPGFVEADIRTFTGVTWHVMVGDWPLAVYGGGMVLVWLRRGRKNRS